MLLVGLYRFWFWLAGGLGYYFFVIDWVEELLDIWLGGWLVIPGWMYRAKEPNWLVRYDKFNDLII